MLELAHEGGNSNKYLQSTFKEHGGSVVRMLLGVEGS